MPYLRVFLSSAASLVVDFRCYALCVSFAFRFHLFRLNYFFLFMMIFLWFVVPRLLFIFCIFDTNERFTVIRVILFEIISRTFFCCAFVVVDFFSRFKQDSFRTIFCSLLFSRLLLRHHFPLPLLMFTYFCRHHDMEYTSTHTQRHCSTIKMYLCIRTYISNIRFILLENRSQIRIQWNNKSYIRARHLVSIIIIIIVDVLVTFSSK